MGLDRERFYGEAVGVAAMAFCYPGTAPGGGDYAPPRRCAALWRARLMALLPNVALTLLLGRPAQIWALGAQAGASMGEVVARWRDFGPDVFVAPHPSWRNSAWLKRNPWFEAEAVAELKLRVQALVPR